jgi:hypothetical protein
MGASIRLDKAPVLVPQRCINITAMDADIDTNFAICQFEYQCHLQFMQVAVNMKKKRKYREPAANQLRLYTIAGAGTKWELASKAHCLTDEQPCVVVSLMAPHLKKDTFPPTNGNPLMELASEKG